MGRGLDRLPDEVVVLEPTVDVDPYDKQTRVDFNNPTSATPWPADMQPATSTELTDNRQTVISRWYLMLTSQAVIEPAWRVRWRGDDFDVDGDIEVWWDDGYVDHQSCYLQKVKG